MHRHDFNYELPPELIAQMPLAERTASRLLCLDPPQSVPQELPFRQFDTLLGPGDLLVFNDTRVIAARLFGYKPSGGRVEIMLEKILDDKHFLAQIRTSKRLGTHATINIAPGIALQTVPAEGGFHKLRIAGGLTTAELFMAHGQVPLPPYIKRAPDASDSDRYQTVYAREAGAVAAPTAGLHFDHALLERLRSKGIQFGFVTLHVGAGTFQPMRADVPSEHKMHREFMRVTSTLVEQVRATQAGGGRVVAVGTTVVRALETASAAAGLEAYAGHTDIFIYPGYQFRTVDALLTNFHLPESTLLMLVCAFAGRDRVLAAYRHAVQHRFRFFSYGDAMWVPRRAI